MILFYVLLHPLLISRQPLTLTAFRRVWHENSEPRRFSRSSGLKQPGLRLLATQAILILPFWRADGFFDASEGRASFFFSSVNFFSIPEYAALIN